jgi:hypothetical protein
VQFLGVTVSWGIHWGGGFIIIIIIMVVVMVPWLLLLYVLVLSYRVLSSIECIHDQTSL